MFNQLAVLVPVLALLAVFLVPAAAELVPPAPEAVRQKCLDEGGTWIDGTCVCPENKTFTPRWGCRYITPPELCAQTGGSWGPAPGRPVVTEGLADFCLCPAGRVFDEEKGCIVKFGPADYGLLAAIAAALAVIVLYIKI
jgi:hypothetical protein